MSFCNNNDRLEAPSLLSRTVIPSVLMPDLNNVLSIYLSPMKNGKSAVLLGSHHLSVSHRVPCSNTFNVLQLPVRDVSPMKLVLLVLHPLPKLLLKLLLWPNLRKRLLSLRLNWLPKASNHQSIIKLSQWKKAIHVYAFYT